ncbi:SAM-dependent methyltransferase [Methylocystis heyeri]|uniref:Methyltransferase domain-containing protein n=1 Tax=Methylocystis heyeri TaxID=391905 RepID=A0A6B8KEM1_9HYPH|nr:cyclopropane-fatty-acyl-phospholipid synthase family protein [Methylocystis heyeri]QGM46914.1 methyltransferase domain-containing protein [Methylocystis heyeri]
MSLRSETLRYLCSRGGRPPSLRLVFRDGEAVDFVPSPQVTVFLRSPKLLRALIGGDFGALADAYIQGEIVVDGSVEEILQAGVVLAERLESAPVLQVLTRFMAMLARIGSTGVDASHVRYQYDASNDFYRLWLDERMIYSCAYFRSGSEDIDTAQEQKLEHICRKLLLRPGDRLLDIGCGWGGLLRWAAQRRGAVGLGVTLSEPQSRYARERLVDDDIEIRLQDYRDVEEAAFDKIVSVDVYEHVGSRNLPAHFQKASDLLRPGGVFLNQGMVARDSSREARPAPGGRIDKYLFPGGALAPLSRVVSEASGAGFEVVDVEDLRPHYIRTLERWSRRLEAREQEAIEAAGVERYRIWKVYLAAMAAAFERGSLSVAQLLLYKPVKNGWGRRPWTRDYQYDGDADPPSPGASVKSRVEPENPAP